MAAHSTFAGLKRLAARAGIKLSAGDAPAPIENDDENDGEGEAAPGDDENETPGAEPTGNAATGEEGDEANDAAAAGDEGEDAGTGAEAAAQPARRSADFLAGQRYGAEQTAGRFAAVLVSPVARANLEMATDLLANSTMTPAAIIDHCDRYKGEHAAKTLLEQTPKVSLGAGGGGSQAGTDEDAAASRKTATKRVNAGAARAAKQAGTPVRPSRRAAAAGKAKEQ